MENVPLGQGPVGELHYGSDVEVDGFREIGRDLDRDGFFSPDELTQWGAWAMEWATVGAGESKTFAIMNDTTGWAGLGKDHFSATVTLVPADSFVLADANGAEILPTFDQFSGRSAPLQHIVFK